MSLDKIKRNETTKKYLDKNPLCRYSMNFRVKVKNYLTRGIFPRKNSDLLDILGISLEGYKAYLEMQFDEGMSWHNNTKKGWHIDHIIPTSKARDLNELKQLLHYTNTRPLWAKENLKKYKND